MIIYKTTCLINGKLYIGQSRETKNVKKDYLGSGILIIRAVKKYGKKNFKREILEMCSTIDQLDEKEKYWITLLKTTDPKIGYNLSFGGHPMNGISYSEKHRKNISKSLSGIKRSDEHKEILRKFHTGKKLSTVTKQKLHDANIGKKLSDETKRKIGLSGEGRIFSKITRTKISNKLQDYWISDKAEMERKRRSEYFTGRPQPNPRHKKYWTDRHGQETGLMFFQQFKSKQIDKLGNPIS